MTWDDSYKEFELPSAAWPDVERHVRLLDGNSRTLVMVQRGTGHAAVGGGCDSGLVAYVTFDGETFHQLLGVGDGDAVVVVAGGQAAPFPRAQVVDVGTALAALRTFVETGALNEELQWERT